MALDTKFSEVPAINGACRTKEHGTELLACFEDLHVTINFQHTITKPQQNRTSCFML